MKQLKFLSLCVALMAGSLASSAQSSCYKTPYSKTIQIKASDNNIVENSSFEDGKYGWQFAPDSNRAKITADPVNASRKVVRIVSTDNAGGDALITQTTPNLTAGNTYVLSAYLRSKLATNATKNITLQMRFNYPSGDYVTIPAIFYPTTT